MTDRLDLANAIEATGIERKAAEHLAATIVVTVEAASPETLFAVG